MLRKVVKTMVVGGAMLAMVGAANAAEININLYGASAQYLFWNDTADEFIESLGGTVAGQAEDSSGKQGITSGTLPNNDTINIRYAAKASFDGVYACKGELAASVTDPCATSNGPRYRQMVNSLGDLSLGCYEVTLGASDVDGKTFGQRSIGALKGHLGDQTPIDRTVPAIDTTGLTSSYNPLVVPFAFFASADAPVENLTRTQALMIFSGKALFWSDFGLDDERDIVACLRHAGSGTQATLEAAVMRNDQVTLLDANEFYLYNDGSSDMMRCINQRGGKTSATAAAVGYADADQGVGAGTSYTDTKRIKYEGADASKENIVNGVYSFWSTQWLWNCDPSNTTTTPVVNQLMAFAADPANLPEGKAAFWAAENEMNVTKSSDFAMPSF